MSETLRDLVVSLSLNSDNFTRNIRSVQKQIQEAQSSFKLASAGVTDFEKTTAGLSAKQETLKRTLSLQKDAVGQYERALQQASGKLRECSARQEDYAQRLEEAQARQAQLRQEVAGATATYQRYRATLGETDSATIAAKSNLDLVKEEYRQQTAEVKKLAGQQVALQKTTQNAADAFSSARTKLNNARAAVKQTQADLESCNKALKTAKSEWTAAGKALEGFGKKAASAGKSLTSSGKSLTTTVTPPILAMGTAAVRASLDFESSFTSVRKTVDATESEFDALVSASKTMSTQVAASTSQINEVMATAGQLGIANDYLVNFTRTMIDLGNSTNIMAEDAASTLAKFANITSMDQAQFGNLGATLVDLGNNFATTEADIMSMSLRLAAAGEQVGLTEPQILGFAAALSSVGIRAEMGGSAFSKALINMEVAAETGGDALEDFARVSGMTAEAFKTLWDRDPAAAFQAFISGLAQMDEEGISAIATLDEIGIAEIRLRDTLLRSVNANELFAEAQRMANTAWSENTALTEEANKRYATTESRLANLKNTAVLFAQQIGDDLNPTIQSLIDGAAGLLGKFMELDEGQRQQIVKMAAYAAAAGPVLLMLGKITKGVGTLSTGIGKFSTAVGNAGGGMSGFLSVLGKSPAAWLALAAATVTATVALADYLSGAKQAREALESMRQTAEDWKHTAAETFYGTSEGLSFFGMNEENFSRQAQTAREWLDGLLKVWTDGEKETDEIVSSWTESFKRLTASTKEQLANLKATADESGYTGVSKQLAQDMKTLDSLDAEIKALLKKRQNGFFSKSEQTRLQELIDTREAIEVKYHLTPADTEGFEEIGRRVEAEVTRAKARGQSDADVSVYENAVKAAAEGMAAVNRELDAQYDKEREVIQLMEDASERQSALDGLNARYNENRLAAAREYAATLAGVVMPVWEQDSIRQANQQIDSLLTKLREYSMAGEGDKPKILEDLANLSTEMDEGALTEYLGLLTQIQSLMDSGLGESEVQTLFPDIDVSSLMDQFAGIAEYIGLIKTDLPGLYSMFHESLPEEALKIATDLDMTGAQARWNEFAANPGAITTEAIITGYQEGEGVTAPRPHTRVVITGYDYLAYSQLNQTPDLELEVPVRLGELDEGEFEEKLNAGQVKYWRDGVEIPVNMVPENAVTPDTVATLDADGTLHVLITPEVTGTQEAIEAIRPVVDEIDRMGATTAGKAIGLLPSTTMDSIEAAIERLRSYQETLDYNWWDKFWASVRGESTNQGVLDTSMKMDFSAGEVAGISAYVSELVSAIQQGQQISEQDLTNLQNIVTFLNGLDVTGTGQHIKEGVAQGMTEAGWDSDAETVAANLEAALNSALGIQSPSTRMKPTGSNVAAGVGVGMNAYSFTADASALASRLSSAVFAAMPASLLRPAGLNAMRGLTAGIHAGRSGVIAAMRSAARAAVNAAKAELEIHSPSRVFEEEVGAMAMKGLGQGVLKESKEQARVIRNAVRYLTGEAKAGGIMTTSNDNRRTYNQQSTISFAGSNFYINDQQDAYALAVEIASLTRRQQRGRGLRMA